MDQENVTDTDGPHYIRHRSRLRERFRRAGAGGLNDYELLELLLTYSIPRRDVKPVAKTLLGRFNSISGVLDADLREIEGIPQVGPSSGTLLKLVKELFSAYMSERIEQRSVLSSPDDVIGFSRVKLAGLPHEAFMVIYLNTKNEVLDHAILHEGTIDRAIVYPRRIIETALARHAAGVILVHNHPSGHPEPSVEDRQLTRAIAEAARLVDIRVVDHIVVGGNAHFSFAASHILP